MKNLPSFWRQFRQNLRQNIQAMSSPPSSANVTSSESNVPSGLQPPYLESEGLEHTPAASSLIHDSRKQLCNVQPLSIVVSSSGTFKSVSGFLHTPQNNEERQSRSFANTAAILVSGASGGLVGPSSIYLSIADKLASLSQGVPVLRLDYRYPARNKYCVPDILAAMSYLQNVNAISRFVLVGWSYGGAPVFTVGAQDDRVVGCATIASQTAETEGIVGVARKNIPILLFHGTGDRRLSPTCSQSLYERYKKHSSDGQCELKLFEGDDHSLTKNSLKAEELLCNFILQQADTLLEGTEHESVLQKPLMGEQEKIEKMKISGDLRAESIR